jgi:DNA-binding FrmR family transcriptional regulator
VTARAPAADRPTVAHAQRMAGQAAAVAGMVSAGRPYAAVVQQLLAARGSLDSLLVRIVELELARVAPQPEPDPRIAGVLRTAFDRSHRVAHGARDGNRAPTEPVSSERTVS